MDGRYAITCTLLIALLIQCPEADEVRKAAERAGKAGYAYEVRGRHKRTGEYQAPGILVSRLGDLSSVRAGNKLMMKGAMELWKDLIELLPEDFPGDEGARIRQRLIDARPPHEMVAEVIGKVGKLKKKRKNRYNRRLRRRCTEYVFEFDPDKLRQDMNLLINQSILARRISKPDRIKWKSMKAKLTVYLDAEGRLIGAQDERAIELEHARVGSSGVVHFSTSWEYVLSEVGETDLSVSEEILKRMKVK